MRVSGQVLARNRRTPLTCNQCVEEDNHPSNHIASYIWQIKSHLVFVCEFVGPCELTIDARKELPSSLPGRTMEASLKHDAFSDVL